MTFCLGMKTHDGLVGIADTRLSSGTQIDVAKKVTLHAHAGHEVFVMTSGLRSVRDKTLTYFEVELAQHPRPFARLYELVNFFAAQLRRVGDEDREFLGRSGLRIDLQALIGGQLDDDVEQRLYMVYSEGNWVEVSRTTPYHIIGESDYGKPVLDRMLRYESDVYDALKVGMLAFDATRTSASDVGYPLDVVTFRAQGAQMHEHRFEQAEVQPLSDWWSEQIHALVEHAPQEIVAALCRHAFGP